MKEIQRKVYLDRLISRRENGVIKIITGIRRCGKSYLLDPIFKNYLIQSGVREDHIIKLELDKEENKKYRDSHVLNEYIKSLIKDKEMYYILLDEIQLVEGFEAVLNGFLYERNLDVYVTGSNSKFLSSDIITEFRGRGDEVKIFPLSFSEYIENFEGDKYEAWNEYVLYGGLPLILSKKTDRSPVKTFCIFANVYKLGKSSMFKILCVVWLIINWNALICAVTKFNGTSEI